MDGIVLTHFLFSKKYLWFVTFHKLPSGNRHHLSGSMEKYHHCRFYKTNNGLVVITHELIYSARAAHRQGKKCCETGLLTSRKLMPSDAYASVNLSSLVLVMA